MLDFGNWYPVTVTCVSRILMLDFGNWYPVTVTLSP